MEESIRIRILDGQYRIIGGDFQSMLAFIRQQPQRQFKSGEKLWEIPQKVADLQKAAEAAGFHITADTEMGHAIESGPRRPKRGQADRIIVQLGEQEYAVVGNTFQVMLDVVKAIEGRRWLSREKAWSLPLSLDALRQQLQGYNLQVVTPDEAAELPALEPSEVQPIQVETQVVTPRRDQIRLRASDGEGWVVGGAFRDMLEVIKNMEGRRFVSEEKLWEVPVSLAAMQEVLQPHGFTLEGMEALSSPRAMAGPDLETMTGRSGSSEPPEGMPDIPWDEPPLDEEDEYLF